MINLNLMIVLLVISALIVLTLIGEEKNKSEDHMSKAEFVLEMVGIIFIVWLIYLKPDYISIYRVEDSNLQPVIPLFNNDELMSYHPMILLVYGIGVLFLIGKLVKGKWGLELAVLHLIYRVGSYGLLCSMMLNSSLYNPLFFEELFIYTPSVDWSFFCEIIMLIIGCMTLFDVIKPFLRLIKDR